MAVVIGAQFYLECSAKEEVVNHAFEAAARAALIMKSESKRRLEM